MIEDLLHVIRDIISIQEVVSHEVIIFIGTGYQTRSHLEEQLLSHSILKEREVLGTAFNLAH